MILRRPSRDADLVVDHAQTDDHPYAPVLRRTPLRWQIVSVTALIMALAVTAMTIVAYVLVSLSLRQSVDQGLEDKASNLLQAAHNPSAVFHPEEFVAEFKTYNPDVRLTFYPPDSTRSYGDMRPSIVNEVGVLLGNQDTAFRESGMQRILAKSNSTGAKVILVQDMSSTYNLIRWLGWVLLIMGVIGVLVAIAAGMAVSTAVMRPVNRLRRAVDYVARTDDLTPIAVSGNDEMAQLTRSFNEMLAALAASRRRQTELVADAGHELKTPLTSLRTNMELLMMVSRDPSSAGISDQDRKDLERDVIAQIEELSQLIGDLVDLAREDGPQNQTITQEVDLVDTIETSLERVRRRRPDVTFVARCEPWYIDGDGFALGRAMLNLLDNAAKWSPPHGKVRIEMTRVALHEMEITVSDSGPGIPLEDREKVFERFYRSIQARSMTGSGLGLAIVAQVIARHNGTITAEESDDGGAMMRVCLPGNPDSQPGGTS